METVIPSAPPPMAEVGRANGTDPALVLDITADQNRLSTGSANSDNSQFLVIHHRESLQPENWAFLAMGTESFPFPKPPPVDSSSLHSRASAGSHSGFPRRDDPEVLYVASPGRIRSITHILPAMQPMQASPLFAP
jgi:hypothetical protein